MYRTETVMVQEDQAEGLGLLYYGLQYIQLMRALKAPSESTANSNKDPSNDLSYYNDPRNESCIVHMTLC